MTKTQDYMDYLDEKIGIAPAHSQEEYQASEVISNLMREHGVEITVQEFDSQGSGEIVRNILALIMFVAVVVEGLVPDMMHLVLLLVAAACAGVLAFIYFVRNPFEGLGPTRRSQNVIGVRRARATNAARGSRPIVIVAHYDTPRESILYRGLLGRYHATIVRVGAVCPVVVAGTLLFQLLAFLPEPFRMFMWIAGLLASVPVLFVSVMSFAARAANCTVGANCNKSGVAALLSMVDRLNPANDAATGMAQKRQKRRQEARAQSRAQASSADTKPQRVEMTEDVVGVRHGEEVLRSLNILPPSCEITYEEPRLRAIEDTDERTYGRDYESDEDENEAYVSDSYDMGADEADEVDDYDDYGPDEDDWGDDDWSEDSDEVEETDESEVSEGSDDDLTTGEGKDDEADEEDENVRNDSRPRRRLFASLDSEDEDEADESGADYYDDDDDEYEDDGDEYSDYDYEDEYDEDEGDEPMGSAIGAWFSTRFSALRERFAPGAEDEEEWIDEEDLEADNGDAHEDSESEEAEVENLDYEDTEDEDELDVSYDFDDDFGYDSDEEYDDEYEDEDFEDELEEDDEFLEKDYDALADMAFDEEQEAAYVSDFEYAEDENPEDDFIYRAHQPDVIQMDEDDELPDDEAVAEEACDEEYYEDYEDATYDDDYDEYDEQYDEEAVEGQEVQPSIAEKILRFLHLGARDAQVAESYDDDEYYLEDESELEDDYQNWDDSYEDEESFDEDDPEPRDEESYESMGEEDYDTEYDGQYSDEPPARLTDPNMLHFDREEDDDILPRDDSGLNTISDSYDLYSGEVRREVQRERPAAVEDPAWGTSNYKPTRPNINIARRAALYDVPDPSGSTVDPLEQDYEYEEEVVTTGPRSGFWHEDSNGRAQSSHWKGGAAIRDDLRDEASFDEGDLQDAMLEMGDEFIDGHDIWFVATGASENGHAGIKAFLDEHRREIRGAFLVNLECVGAGSLAVYAREGLYDRRRADRRLVRLVCDIARDLHIDFGTAMCDWGETDAASALRARVRAITIVGLDENDQPAFSHASDDVPQNTNPSQVDDVVRMVTEVIRRA